MIARNLMIQGTMSGAGKSLLCTGLCRIFAQDGLRVAPFKSQNMSLNSFVTADGLEMGRAQVMQAQAAGVEPDVRMNPILLKPTSDKGSQVILHGEVLDTLSAEAYYKLKPRLIPSVLEAYFSLAVQFDVMVIEGAGSPAEINLREHDLVNMGLAELVHAPVLLVGDIDRGGVFAQLFGTLELLSPDERERVKGLVINKFRGDESLLRPGLVELERLCGVSVLGVVPYLSIDVDDEDSLAPRLVQRAGAGTMESHAFVDVAVIRLPRISNFTDFAPLEVHVGITLRYVDALRDLGSPDVVVLPGTKNTMGDLRWLNEQGFAEAIRRLADRGSIVLGICGGYQMLGEMLIDPLNTEGEGAMSQQGLGLLPVRTRFDGKKTRARVSGSIPDDEGFPAVKVEGYEIHMGKTEYTATVRPFCLIEGKPDGCVCENVGGTYVHGVFDTGELTEALVTLVTQRKGVAYEPSAPLTRDHYLNQQYDKLAAALRESLDIDAIYRLMEEAR